MFMRTLLTLSLFLLTLTGSAQELFPDGTLISDWFKKTERTDIDKLGKHYRITDYDVMNDSTVLQTQKIQAIIDEAYESGGGVIIIPKGTFLSSSLFFKQGTHLHLEENAILKASDDISDFPLIPTRMEGQNLNYFGGLVNADGLDGFTISGKGTLDGNGHRYWRSFWLRREFNRQCTNMEELRPRVLYVSNSKNVQISGIRLINSPYWTSHYYKCENVKLLDLYIYSPQHPVKAPSSDAIDLDVCQNVLVKNCYMSVNDDAIALKGGKGPFADKDDNNGGNYNIIIEDCKFGFCHSALTCGSESIHNRNIILRRTTFDEARKLLQLKMRPDTPQHYEYILIEDITGNMDGMIGANPWTQFFNLKGEKDIKVSYANNITFRNIDIKCDAVFPMDNSDQYVLSDFIFENMKITSGKEQEIPSDFIKNFVLRNSTLNGRVFSK